ncbi:hypothetical protein SERLA73DRAFT_49448 [Serpula lacrymans var. lacrymans S7.3]|uniref:Ubiquitin-like domain-containing protein n=2 Tax=Serpula lacrymans var. lacrymans TaxID=341189 RepID=F8PNR6_SERL3|nr:uncharacterized protein SERLADRAFT_460822 [Serpula lacrymans var. lacrymans S7.9]EGO01793.1 hypothetical protein SERLA73DRAFT_49448 [Serpula lacrymans var. lacrymans S7.3]EGO27427.1 hypothetical protein SERLADRAFT_460822 [Serpula lacrymans var. lacrymans S7.9]
MSLVPIRVELPTYSHSFTVQVYTGAIVLDVKQAIFAGCTGQPRVEGQRLIWRGRYLNDEEKISDIWKSPEEQRVVHLAVHHSAWSASPPTVPRSSSPATRLASASQAVQPPQIPASPFGRPQQTNATQSSHQPSVTDQQLGFIAFKHQNAISILTNDTILPPPSHLEASRMQVKLGLENSGYIWPNILDEEYPVVDQSEGGGLTYERVTIEGRNYLTLRNPEGKPSSRQAHALKTLTYTYPLLSFNFPHLPFIPTNAVYERVASPAHMTEFLQHTNEFLQRLDLPPVQIPQINNAQNVPAPDAEADRLVHEIPVRALLAPLMMVIVRTLLLLYFISPARKPIIGMCIIAMIMYEMWAHVRVVIVRPFNQGAENNPQAPQQNGGAADAQFAPQGQGRQPGAQAPAGPNGNQGQPGPQNRPRLPTETQADGVLHSLALTNIHSESHALWPMQGAQGPREPGLLRKLVIFLSLLILTLHPAVWNKRRAALKQREGQLRTELNAMESDARDREDGTREASSNDANSNELRQTEMRARLLEQHARRPRWVKEYVQRARSGEFLDD